MAAATTMAQTVIMPQAMETEHLRLHAKGAPSMTPHPPSIQKPNTKLKIDPLRALEPARKKLSTVEAQRVMAVLVDTIKKTDIITCLPYILENLDRFRVVLGTDLVQMLQDHKQILDTFDELKNSAEKLLDQGSRASKVELEDGDNEPLSGDGKGSRPGSAASITSQADSAIRSLSMVAHQMQQSCKNILRSFCTNPAAMNAIMDQKMADKATEAKDLITNMDELREIILCMLLTTPVEEAERNQYLKEITQRERYNSAVIEKLEKELDSALSDKEEEIRKKNDVIRQLQADLHQIEKFSEEHIRRNKSEAEKQEAADTKNSEGKRQKLQAEINQLRTQLQSLVTEHRESEQVLRKRKYKIETEVENWIQKYDQDMGDRQAEYEEIDAVYTEEKKQLNELEERFKTLEAEYNQIMEERRIARERREAAERELQMCIKAATTIQAFWRSFKVRKALKSKKKKGKGKKGKKN